jgi:phosphoribosylformimino-5-aminoimidazole carboxamide ribotide isomerase
MLEIIPAIDMMDGKCVRLVQGKFDRSTVFSDDPVDAAKRWVDEGATRLHLVDLNGSRYGAPQETATVARILKAVDVPVQLGGGIRTLKIAADMIDLGVGRVILGTSAALDYDLAESIFQTLGEGAVLGVDAKDGYVAVKGWEEITDKTAIDFAVQMQKLGAKRIIYTDISRDGMLKGVNVPAMKEMAEAVAIPVIASGGVTGLDDIHKLKALESCGIEGVIAGKALYTGDVELNQAMKIASAN